MDPQEFEVMARVERNHPWFVNRRRLIRGLVRRITSDRSRRANRAPLRVLDAGCGTGVNLSDYETLGWAVGIELDHEAARISARGGRRLVAAGSLCRLPFADASFDLVISTDVIEHIDDDVAALGEMRRVLAPAGHNLLTTPAYSWAYSGHDRHLHHVRRYDERRLHAAVRRARLRVLHAARYNVLLACPVLLARWWGERHGDRPNGSDVGRPVPPLAVPALDLLWQLEACLAQRIDLRIGLTHVAVLARV